MSKSVGNEDFDAEAQESILAESSSTSSSTSVDAKQKFVTSILLVRFVLRINRARHHASSSATDYTSIHIPHDDDDQDDDHRGSGTAVTYADSPQDTTSAHDPPPSAQQLQRQKISEIVKTKNLELLREFGGVRGVAEAINADIENGIPIPQQTNPNNPTLPYQFFLILFHSFRQSCNNVTVFLLSCAAVLSLWFGIKEDGRRMGWLNGGILLATVLLIVAGTTVRTCWEKWLSNKTQSSGRMLRVKVVRGGCTHIVGEKDLVVGDIVNVHEGDQLPADGLFIGGDHGHEALRLDDGSTLDEHSNPFMFYGYKVMRGEGRMLITSTGVDTVWGERMIQAAIKKCYFECYLYRLFVCVNHLGLLISILIIVVLFFRYISGKLDDERRYRPESKGDPTQLKVFADAMKAIITGSKGTSRVIITLLSVSLLGIMEGVPFLISFSILRWSRKTLACKALERDSFTCVNMARLTTICTDVISGALTEQELGLIHWRLYVGNEFVSDVSNLDSQVVETLCDAIIAPSLLSATATDTGDQELLSWAESELGMDRNLIQQSKEIVHNTLNRPNLQLIKEKNGSRGIWHCNGPPDQIMSMCSHHYGIDGQILQLDGQKKSNLEWEIGHMVAEDAQVTAYACKHIQGSTHEVSHHQQQNDFTFLAMMSKRKTKMEAIKLSVSRLKEEQVRVIIASGEDVSVLKSIAQKCGLLTIHDLNSDDLVLTSEEFRRLDDAERKNKVDQICIIGNCSPEDKFLLVECLKETEQVVALVAHKTVDAPALKLSDIGLTYEGNSISEIVRECSDITLLDANLCCFGFLLNAIKSGRCLLENIRKFIQMQLIFAISSSLINFTAIVALGDAPITAVQLFSLCLVVTLLGGLALLTGSGAPTPIESSEKLMTWEMWRTIGVQVCYQTSVFVGVQHWGKDILGTSGERVKLVIYNAFALCQMFIIFIASQPRKMNIFSGLFHNSCWFWVALLLFIICQAVIAAAEEFIGGGPGLSLQLWGACLVIAFLSWPVDLAAKMLFFATFNHP